jgi:LysM repeat protein
MKKKQISQQSQNDEFSSLDFVPRDLGSNQALLSNMQNNSYTVKQGESFWSIADKLGTSMQNLLSINNMNENDIIHPGQNLKLPNSSGNASPAQNIDHTVVVGDNLWDIAQTYNVSFGSLLSVNQMTQWTTIYPGMKITIPKSGSTSSNNSSSTKTPEVSQSKTENKEQAPSTIQEPQKKTNAQNGYDPVLGKALARDSMSEAAGKTRAGGDCYYGVANSVDRVVGKFLTGMHAYMAASQLAQRKNLFTEVPATSLRSLPAGAIVVWGKGTSDSGHISIAQGNGMETSDFIGNQMTYHYGGAAARVFLPKGTM